MPDTYIRYGTREQVAAFEEAARRGLATQAAENAAELAAQAGDLANVLRWLLEAGVCATAVGDAAGIMADAIVNADARYRSDLDEANDARAWESIDLGELRALAG